MDQKRTRPLMRKGQRVVMLVPGVNGNQDQGNLIHDEGHSSQVMTFRTDGGDLVNAMAWELAPIPKP